MEWLLGHRPPKGPATDKPHSYSNRVTSRLYPNLEVTPSSPSALPSRETTAGPVAPIRAIDEESPAGDNDWLEFSNWGVVFWKARVADFVVNQLYFAVIPDSALRSGPNFWGFYLNTSAPADSQLYVPRVPAPPAPK